MRLDRISLQLAEGEVRTFEFHRGLTVVEADAGAEAELARALLGTLARAGDGVHVELTLDDGSELVVFRPFGAAHRVIDVRTSADRTAEYAGPDGAIDALAPHRAGPSRAEAGLLLTAPDLLELDPDEAWAAQLATVAAADPPGPAGLFRSAEESVAAEEELRQASAAARTAPPTASPRGETAGPRRETATERRYRLLLPATAVVGSGMAVGAAVGVDTFGTGGSLALIGGSLGLVAATLLYGRKVTATGRRAARTTGPAAAPSDADRGAASRLAVAAGRYQQASTAWSERGGSVPAPWVLAERERIERTARLRLTASPDQPGAQPLTTAPEASALITALTVRMGSSHGAGPGAEALPLFLGDPLVGLSWPDKAPVLEFLGRVATEHQLVLVTADPEVLSWARLEAMAGTVGAITAAEAGEEADAAEAAPTPG